jgi:hypothetical protein
MIDSKNVILMLYHIIADKAKSEPHNILINFVVFEHQST